MTSGPIRVDVAIVGGGIIGCSTAWYFAKRGVRVAVLEKGRIAGEQSSRNAGFVRQQGRDLREMPLIMHSLALWRGIDADLEAPTGFVQSGGLATASTKEKAERMHAWAKAAKTFGLESVPLSTSEIAAKLPGLRTSFPGGLYTATDGRAEPTLLTPAVAAALVRRGEIVRENCMVEGLLLEGGKVAGVATETGEVRASAVVLAGGIWCRAFLAPHGINLPLNELRMSLGRTAPFDHGLSVGAWMPDVLVRPRLDGGLTIGNGNTGRMSDFDITPKTIRLIPRYWPAYMTNRSGIGISLSRRFMEGWRHERDYRGHRRGAYPELRVPYVVTNIADVKRATSRARDYFGFGDEMRLAETWAGRIDVTPDGIPVIDAVPGLPGLVVATGMNGHGFAAGLGVGSTVAEFVADGKTSIPIADFSLRRFRDQYFLKPENLL